MDTTEIIARNIGSTHKEAAQIAMYSTEEKAIKAMEMMRIAYAGFPVIFNIPEDIERMMERTKMNGIVAVTDDKNSKIEYVNNAVFQFPKDEDVEV